MHMYGMGRIYYMYSLLQYTMIITIVLLINFVIEVGILIL